MDLKIVCFSDSHGYHRSLDVGSGDILIFAGDAMTCGYKSYELGDFLNWFEAQDFEVKIMVAGNHDRFIENNYSQFREILKDYPSIIYLEDEGVEIAGIKFWGTPHSRKFGGWAFNQTGNFMKVMFDRIDEDTDILISHAPSYGIRDRLIDGTPVGEESLRENTISRLKNLKYHIFGHVHNDYGKSNVFTLLNKQSGYIAVNCSVVNEAYQVSNKPIIINYAKTERKQEQAEGTNIGRVTS